MTPLRLPKRSSWPNSREGAARRVLRPQRLAVARPAHRRHDRADVRARRPPHRPCRRARLDPPHPVQRPAAAAHRRPARVRTTPDDAARQGTRCATRRAVLAGDTFKVAHFWPMGGRRPPHTWPEPSGPAELRRTAAASPMAKPHEAVPALGATSLVAAGTAQRCSKAWTIRPGTRPPQRAPSVRL